MAIIVGIIFFALACSTGDTGAMFMWFLPLFGGAIGGIFAFIYDDKHNRRRRRARR